MVAKLIGEINGDAIVFERTEGGQWNTTVPLSLFGEYIVALTAYDEAGNTCYVSKVLFTVDPANLTISMMPLRFYADLINAGDTFALEVKVNKGGGCRMRDSYYILGEDKRVVFEVKSARDEVFFILDATYELYYDKELEASGACEIDGALIKVKLNPERRSGLYSLIVTYKITDEVFKKRIRLEVS